MKTTPLSLYVMHLLYVHVIKKKVKFIYNHCITLYKLNFKKGKERVMENSFFLSLICIFVLWILRFFLVNIN